MKGAPSFPQLSKRFLGVNFDFFTPVVDQCEVVLRILIRIELRDSVMRTTLANVFAARTARYDMEFSTFFRNNDIIYMLNLVFALV